MNKPNIELNRPGNLRYFLDGKYVLRDPCPLFGSSALFTYNYYVGLRPCFDLPWDASSCKHCGTEEYLGSIELMFNTIQARIELVSE